MKPNQRLEKEGEEAREPQPETQAVNLSMEDEPEVLHHSPIHHQQEESLTTQMEEMSLTLTQSRISDMEGLNASLISREAGVVAASFDLYQVLNLYYRVNQSFLD